MRNIATHRDSSDFHYKIFLKTLKSQSRSHTKSGGKVAPRSARFNLDMSKEKLEEKRGWTEVKGKNYWRLESVGEEIC